METLPIVWQRLVSAEGRTCHRCQSTLDQIERGMTKLRAALPPLGIDPSLEIRETRHGPNFARLRPHNRGDPSGDSP